MKRMFSLVAIIVLLLAGTALAQMGGQHMMGTGQTQGTEAQPQQLSYPWMGYPMGPAMMGGGYGFGPGMMPMMMGPGMGFGMGPGPGYGMMGMGPGMMMGPAMMPMMQNMMMGPGMMGGGYGFGPGMMGYMYSPQYQKFLDETRDLRKELWDKRFEYFEALRDPDTKPETLTKLRKEIYELRKEILKKAPFGIGRCH